MLRPKWFHLTATLFSFAPALCREDTGQWLWRWMRAAFPEAIAAVLMPSHPHLLLLADDPRACERRLARLLGHFARHFRIEGRIARVAPAMEIRPGNVLQRHVRYIMLNPCRDGLVRCPLAWPWSTHRDVIGAIVDPWITGDRLARALGISPREFVARHHAFVSGDPSAHVASTPLPQPLATSPVADMPLGTIVDAVAAAMRESAEAVRRRGPTRALFVALACDQGWNIPARLAEACDVQARAIPALARSVSPEALRAARLCLADERLRAKAPDVAERRRLG